jgi:serine/threonine protein kinase
MLGRSRLLPADEAEALHRRWKDDTGGADDQVEAFGKFLVHRKVLTPYQAAMVQRGRADGFFLNGYKILDRVGKGQMGGVYKAVHALGQMVALKILPASKARDQHVLGRFQREARLLTQLDHPNVVRAFQVGEAGGVHYIVMEFIEGETLDEVLATRKRLPVPEAARLFSQVLAGLQHLHEKRMIHRDLKPSNLMLSPEPGRHGSTWDCTVKILDIGLGRGLFDEGTPEAKMETQLTVEGAVLGTPDYLAPEQAKDARSADVRADIYSAGCVLYHAVTGRTPYPDTNIMSQMLRHATEAPTPLKELVPDVPPGLQEVLDTFLAKEPEKRYQTPAEAAEALKPFVANTGAAAAPASLVPEYQKWLETESELELRLSLPQQPGAKPGTPAAKPVATPPPPPKPAPTKAGTATAQPLVVPMLPKPGTAPAPALPPPPARPPQPFPEDDEVSVELVGNFPQLVPVPAPQPFPLPEPVVLLPPERRLWELDRRDMLMLGLGGFGVLTAVGLGYGLAQVLRRKPPESDEAEKKE